MTGPLSIAVAGCGPGGMAAALLLAKQGHRVTVFERFESARPIGSGLLIQPSGQLVLDRLGLLDRVEALGSPVTRLIGLAVPRQRRALSVHYRHLGAGAHAIGIHRSSLFDTLFSSLGEAGFDIHTGRELSGLEQSDAGVRPLFADGAGADVYDLFVDATGSRSPLASATPRVLPYGAFWTTIDRPPDCDLADAALDQRYRRAGAMAGIMPVGINPATGNPGLAMFWSVRHDRREAMLEAGLEAWRDQFLAVWPEAEACVATVPSLDALTYAAYWHRTDEAGDGAACVRIGDAWHCTSPQLGQGANMALLDALALATAMDGAPSAVAAAARYRAIRHRHVRLYQWMSLVFTPLYQSDSAILPVARDLLVHYFADWPVLRALVARIVSGRLGLKMP